MSLLTKVVHVQPFRALYLCCKIAIIIIKSPAWILLYLAGVGRPRPSWTLKKTLVVHALREVIESPMRTGQFGGRSHTKEVTSKQCRDARFIWVDKVPSDLIAGEIKKLAQASGAESVRIPAYGFGNWGSENVVPLARDGERIVMHLHGGAFVMGTAHPEDITANIPRGFIQFGQPVFTRVFSVDYRLCASAPYPTSSPFPSSLLDALAGYVYLTRTLGFKPQNVFVSGDSAGGNIALSLTRYLRDNPQLGLGLPGLILFSPWSDPTGTHENMPGGQGRKNLPSDFVKPQVDPERSMGQYGLRSLLGKISVEDARQNPYIAPSSLVMDPKVVQGMFTGFPPSYVVSGGGESLIDAIRILQQRMKADMGDKVVYDEVTDAIHDFVALPLWEPERSNTFKSIVNWVQTL